MERDVEDVSGSWVFIRNWVLLLWLKENIGAYGEQLLFVCVSKILLELSSQWIYELV